MTEEFTVHPEAAKLPPLTDDQFAELVENIKLCGRIIVPIIVDNGQILDGANRWKVSKVLGIACPVSYVANMPEKERQQIRNDVVGFIHSMNTRRNLDKNQRACYAACMCKTLMYNRDHGVPSRLLGGLLTTGGKFTTKTRDVVARVTKLSPSTVQNAMRLMDEAPDLYQLVASGRRTVGKATAELKRRANPKPAPDKTAQALATMEALARSFRNAALVIFGVEAPALVESTPMNELVRLARVRVAEQITAKTQSSKEETSDPLCSLAPLRSVESDLQPAA